MQGVLYNYGGGFGGLAVVMANHSQSHFSNIASLVFSAIIALYAVLLYGNCFYVPKKIREHFTEQFPQFVIS